MLKAGGLGNVMHIVMASPGRDLGDDLMGLFLSPNFLSFHV